MSIKRAEKFLARLEAGGHVASADKHWIKWSPPIKVSDMLEAIELSEDIAVVLNKRTTTEGKGNG